MKKRHKLRVTPEMAETVNAMIQDGHYTVTHRRGRTPILKLTRKGRAWAEAVCKNECGGLTLGEVESICRPREDTPLSEMTLRYEALRRYFKICSSAQATPPA